MPKNGYTPKEVFDNPMHPDLIEEMKHWKITNKTANKAVLKLKQ